MLVRFFFTLLFYFYLLVSLIGGAVLFHSISLLRVLVAPKKTVKQLVFPIESAWARGLLRIARAKVEVRGLENFASGKSYLLLANHLSSFDIFTLLAVCQSPFAFLSKPLYFYIPFLSSCMRHGAHISINRKSPRKAMQSIQRAGDALSNGISIAVFPEGTRNRKAEVGKFKTTPLSLMKFAPETELIPTMIYGTDSIQKKGSLYINQANIVVVFGKPLSPLSPPKSHQNQATFLKDSNTNKKPAIANKKVLMEKVEKTIRKKFQQTTDQQRGQRI